MMAEMSLPRPVSSLARDRWLEFYHLSFVTVFTQAELGAACAVSLMISEDGGRGSTWSRSGAGDIPVGGRPAFRRWERSFWWAAFSRAAAGPVLELIRGPNDGCRAAFVEIRGVRTRRPIAKLFQLEASPA